MSRNTRLIFIFLVILSILVYYSYSNKEGFQVEGFSIIGSLFHFAFIIFVIIIFAWLFGAAFDFGATLVVADKVKKRYGNNPSSPV